MKKYLQNVLKSQSIDISEYQLEQFQKYYDYLLEKNKVMNLTAITEMEDVVIKHFLDSLSIMKYLSFESIHQVIDVGTGAGFPGIPLAIMFPSVSFTLMDSLNKRILFLDEVGKICGLNNISLIHARAEELGRDVMHREAYDLCISRAVANLSVLLEYCIPFVSKGGKFVAYKSTLAEEELSSSKNAQNKLCCKLSEKYSFELTAKNQSTDSNYSRTLLCFEKYDLTSQKYPRANSIPKKKPL